METRGCWEGRTGEVGWGEVAKQAVCRVGLVGVEKGVRGEGRRGAGG